MSYEYVQYKLISGNTTYFNESLNASLFRELIGELELYDFVVLEPSVPLENSIYLQAASLEPPAEQGPMVVEIRLQLSKKQFKHYRLFTADHDEILRLFLNYWGEQRLPDLTNWEDMSEQFQ
ncbi:hypothetical protein [Paenibacillus wenxiniae]|uniref:Uncharacterized protein n=1 Tax=Paenibacillus wenxiniae TaxID=1636843 RepID=A0ABW4RJ35_9BACL